MGNTIEHLDSLFTVHVAPDTLQVASSQPILQYTYATNDHRLHHCSWIYPSERCMALLMTFDEEHTYQIMVMGKIDGKKIDGKKIDGKDVELIRTGLCLFLIFVIQ